MRKAINNQEKFEALEEQIDTILNGEPNNKKTAFEGLIASLQDEAVKVNAKASKTGFVPELLEQENGLLDRLNLVAKTAFDNNMSTSLPCKKGHKGTKYNFYYKTQDVVFDGKPVSTTNTSAALALRLGEVEEKKHEQFLEKRRKQAERSILSNGGKVR